MKRSFNKKNLCLAAAALTLTAGVSVGSAMAYFTTYTTASGGATISLGSAEIVPDETVSAMTKHIRVHNTGDFECYVRVKVLAGDKYKDGLEFSASEGHWELKNGYYECDQIVAPGEKSPELQVKVNAMDSTEDFNVIVIQECTAVLYDENGNPYADWDRIADSSEDVWGGNEGEVVE